MRKKIIITDLSKMKGSRVCIAGYHYSNRVHIRPVIPYEGINEHLLFESGNLIIKPFAIIEFDFLRHIPNPPHSEDWEVNASVSPKLVRNLLESGKIEFLNFIKDDAVSSIFGAEIHEQRYIRAGEGNRSLGTIKANSIQAVKYSLNYRGGYDYRIAFADDTKVIYDLPVTDLAFRTYCNNLRINHNLDVDSISLRLQKMLNGEECFIRLGLGRAWSGREDEPKKHYIFITGVYSFTDYLDGQNYNDFGTNVIAEGEIDEFIMC